jgi:hypothetical protein
MPDLNKPRKYDESGQDKISLRICHDIEVLTVGKHDAVNFQKDGFFLIEVQSKVAKWCVLTTFWTVLINVRCECTTDPTISLHNSRRYICCAASLNDKKYK